MTSATAGFTNNEHDFWRSEGQPAGEGRPERTDHDVRTDPSVLVWQIYDGMLFRPRRMLLVVEPDDGDSAFSAYSPSLPGAAGQGDTVDEAICDLKQSIEELLTAYSEEGNTPPIQGEPRVPSGESVVCRWVEIVAHSDGSR